METPTRFPVLWPYMRASRELLEDLGCPRSVPFGLVLGHETQARHNHSQSVQRLAERGGLDVVELAAVLGDRLYPSPDGAWEAYEAGAISEVLAAVAAYVSSDHP